MRSRRIFTVFFCFLLLFNLTAGAFATEGDVGEGATVAKAALLADPDTGEILFARNIHERLYPASITKIMTALLVLEAVDDGKLAMDTVLTATESAVGGIPNDASSAGIKAGEQLTVEQLLQCILVVSANEAANILAEAVSGTVDGFVALMNQRAKELGCQDTSFMNTNGLQHVDHYSTAWDLYLIAKEAWKNDTFMRLCGIKEVDIPPTNINEKSRKYYTTNYLISTARNADYLYKGANGMKTGSTSDAGYCLVATATRDGRSLISVVLGAERVEREDGTKDTQSFSETVRLFNWGFNNFSRQIILSTDTLLDEVPVSLSQEQNYVKVHPAQEIERLIPDDIDPEKDIQRTLTFSQETVEAPVTKGQVLGQITLSHGDTVYATVDLLADEDVAASRLLVFQRDFMLFLHRPAVKIGAVAFVALILLILILRLISKSRRRRYGYGRGRSGYRGGGYRGRRR